jgi:hypothetical protein
MTPNKKKYRVSSLGKKRVKAITIYKVRSTKNEVEPHNIEERS